MHCSSATIVVLGLASFSALHGAEFGVVSQSAIYDATTGLVAFHVTFNQPPNFFTADSYGRQANDFQYYIAGGPPTPDQAPYANLDSIIRGGEIYLGQGIPIRSVSPPSSDPASGGWGAIRTIVPFTLVGTDLTFSAPLSVISDHSTDGHFSYSQQTDVYGGETQAFEGQSFVCPPCSSGPGQWSGSGGSPITNIVSGRNVDGRLEAFGLGADQQVWHLVQASDGSWGEWARLSEAPVPLIGGPSIGTAADGRLEVFVTAGDNTLWTISQRAPDSWFTASWFSIATGVQGRPGVANDANGDLLVVVRNTGDDLGLIRSTPGQPGWLPMASLGGVITSNPAAGVDANGIVQVVATGMDQALWNIGIAANGAIIPWSSVGGAWKGDPVVALRYGVLDVFVHGNDDTLWLQSKGASGWSGWTGLGGRIIGNPAAVFNWDGRVEAFVIGTDRGLWHIAQTSPGGGQWTNWSTLGGYLANSGVSPVLGLNSIVNVFVVGDDLGLWEISQVFPGLWQ